MSTTQKTAVSRRAVCLDRLARAIHAPSDRYQAWQDILMRRLCLVLWELPLHVQVGLAVATAERYLPAFERKHPHLIRLRELFVRCLTADPPTDDDYDTWYGTLSEEDRGDLADSALRVAAGHAVEATSELAEPTEVTSACMLSVVNAIVAGEEEVWMAVDPEAAQEELERFRRSVQDLPPLPRDWSKYRSSWHRPEVRNAVYAGWDAVVAWLRAADVGQYPDYVDRKKLAWMLRELKTLPRVIHPPYPTRVQEHGRYAALMLATEGKLFLRKLEEWAETIDEVRRGLTRWGGLSYGIQPTEEDVRDAWHLVQLVRDGAPREAQVEAAWRVYRFTADPAAVDSLLHVLPWLAGIEGPPPYAADDAMPPDAVCEYLDEGAAFFERGGNVRGFIPAAEDLSRVRRLRELVMAEGAEEVAERQRLAKELLYRLPPRWDEPPRPRGT